MSIKSHNSDLTDFNTFFQGWLRRQENFREQLQSTLAAFHRFSDQHLRDLIARVLAHYQQYYDHKSRIANHDVSLVFSPPWFSCFEQSFFWIAGFKPGLAFRIVGRSVQDMSRDQAERMGRIRAETVEEERRLETELAKIHESVAAPEIVEITRRGDRTMLDGTYADMDAAVEGLRRELEAVVASADMLRTRTVERVVEVLTPELNVRFLAEATELQLRIRNWGWQVDR
ncbi:hypothetical protein R6Q57_002321 [Mikania cordata]